MAPLLVEHDPESGMLPYAGHFDFLQDIEFFNSKDLQFLCAPTDTLYSQEDELLSQHIEEFKECPPDGFFGDPIKWIKTHPDERDGEAILQRIQLLQARSFLEEHVRNGTAFREQSILQWLVKFRPKCMPFDYFWPVALEPLVRRKPFHFLSPLWLRACARRQTGEECFLFAAQRGEEMVHHIVDIDKVLSTPNSKSRRQLLMRLSGEFLNGAGLKRMDKCFETQMSMQKSVFHHGCRVVRAPCIVGNALVLNNCLIREGRSISWQRAKIIVEDKATDLHQTPTVRLHEPIDLAGANVYRNRFLSSVWRVYGSDACLLMVFMMSRLISNMFQSAGQHEHQPAAWLLVGPTQTYKSSLMRAFAQAVGCSKNLVGEAHSANLGNDELSKLTLVFDDIGKAKASKAKFGIEDLKVHIGALANQTGVSSKGKHVDSSALIMATFNHDNFAKLLERDDAEQTLLSRCVTVSWKSCPAVRGSGHVKALSPHESDMLVASLASLKFDSQSYRSCEQVLEMTCGLTGDSMRRKKNLLACDMMYAIQIWADFLKQSCLAGFPQEEVTLFVKEHMAPSTVKELVSVPQSQVLEDSDVIILKQFIEKQMALLPCTPDGHVSAPICMRWDGEKVVKWSGDCKTRAKKFRELNILSVGGGAPKARIPHNGSWPSKRPPLYFIDLNRLGLKEEQE